MKMQMYSLNFETRFSTTQLLKLCDVKMLNPHDAGIDEDAVMTLKRDDATALWISVFYCFIFILHMNFAYDLLLIQMAYMVMDWWIGPIHGAFHWLKLLRFGPGYRYSCVVWA